MFDLKMLTIILLTSHYTIHILTIVDKSLLGFTDLLYFVKAESLSAHDPNIGRNNGAL